MGASAGLRDGAERGSEPECSTDRFVGVGAGREGQPRSFAEFVQGFRLAVLASASCAWRFACRLSHDVTARSVNAVDGRRWLLRAAAALAIGFAALGLAPAAFAGTPNTVIAVTCDTRVAVGESFNCLSQTVTPVAGTFAYDVTLTGNSAGNAVDHVRVSLRCPNASVVGVQAPEAWSQVAAGGSESGSLGQLPQSNLTGIYAGNTFTWWAGTLPVNGVKFFSLQGTWSNTNATACRFVVSGVPISSAYGESFLATEATVAGFKTEAHTDAAGPVAVTCASCATDGTLSAFKSEAHTDSGLISSSVTTAGVNGVVTLAAQDAQRLDLVWWGVWISLGLSVGLYVFTRAWRRYRAWA